MNILHVVESLERGGLERFVVDLATAQRKTGHNVAVCCLFSTGRLEGELSAAGIPVSCARKRSGFDVTAVRFLWQELRLHEVEVMHSHNAVANYYSAMAALLAPRVRLVNSRHGMGAVDTRSRKERLYRASLVRTAAVAVVCKTAADHFAVHQVAPDSLMQIVHNGIRLDRFARRNVPAVMAARATLAIPPDAFVIGTVGRLNWAKDHAMLIDAFSRMRERQARDRLVIVGDGELRESLLSQIATTGLDDAVKLAGDRSDVAEILHAFDVFAMTSVTEGYSIALLEAAAAGLPAVVSAVGGNAEIVQHGSTGLVVEMRTVEAFCTAFDRLAADVDGRRRMGESARAWAEEHGDLDSVVERYDALYAGRAVMPATGAAA